MKYLAITAAAFATFTAATPAAAVLTTFATYSAVAGANVRWINTGTSPTRTEDAKFFTITPPSSNVPNPVLVNFSFINSLIAPSVTNISAAFMLSAIVAKDTPLSISGTTYIQQGISGSFSFTSTSAILVSGPGLTPTFYAAGSNLLSGTFSDAALAGTRLGSSGAAFASGINGTNITFTSDFLTFDQLALLDFSTSLTAITPGSFPSPNLALRGFRAVAGGSFSADPSPVPTSAIPEPASWALLIAGFSLVGVSMRRRKHAVAA